MDNEFNMRRKMIEGLIKEVQGPRHGYDEIIKYNPWDEYLCGVVIPQSWQNLKGDVDSNEEHKNVIVIDNVVSEDSFESDEINNGFSSTELDAKSMIKSFGISFSLENPLPTLDICATWARYFDENIEVTKAFNLEGDEVELSLEDTAWQRFSFGEIFRVDFANYSSDQTVSEIVNTDDELMIVKTLKKFESECKIPEDIKDGHVKIYIKRLKIKSLYTFSVYMVNDLNYIQKPEHFHADIDKCLFQPSLRINCSEKIETPSIDFIDESEEEFGFLYRNKPNVAVGHMCSAIWDSVDYEGKIDINQLWPDYKCRFEKNTQYGEFLHPHVRTEFVPLYPVALPIFDLEENQKLQSSDLDAGKLANQSPDELYDVLIKLTELYSDWICNNKAKLKDISEQYYGEIASKLVSNEDLALTRIKRGIELIKNEDLVYTAFCFANKVMTLQNSWGSNKKEFEWRPFQIAFFLMSLEDIFEENSPNKDILDLLWIPTGGGKTEAYLGIMAFTMALRRLKAYENNQTGAGISIISRYTLRLLTVQQFRRTLKMVTAAELLRINKSDNGVGWRPSHSKINGDWIYGSTRFSTGLWVGGGVSPIHLLKEGGAMDVLKEKEFKSTYSPGDPAQIIKCPICGSWLSVPKSGLKDKLNKLHLVIKSTLSKKDVESTIKELFESHDLISLKDINYKDLHDGYYTLSFEIIGPFTQNQFVNDIIVPIMDNECEIASLGRFNIGYFNSLNSIEKIPKAEIGEFDFEIWCTNPECALNDVEWSEGSPYLYDDDTQFPDGNYKRVIYSPFKMGSRMPIPAYVIDDHVYSRCPTIIISTADKIARLAFEPRASALFGNVNNYNKYFGYNRNGMLPRDSGNVKRFNVKCTPLKSPDLIIQDELHLIDGPLGSLFGLYESIVSAIIKKQGGNPKYIASTATISNATKQVEVLFSKDLFQFPPHGLDISNNFFVRERELEEAWDENNPGRVYLGVYAPGRGPMTPQVKLWARMFNISNENIDEKNINKYWTIAGYYNTIKELGGALALYRDDIFNRLENISRNKDYDRLGEDNKEELSSRISSIDLPIILDDLERDGLNKIPNFDAIFATSMFGTGVDISHLSLMIMTSQPKTTGSYIQATGRIGRKIGGLIVDFFKAGRPRDLNHYEHFASYHSRINLGVEPVSVSPFSQGCISRGLGPAIVAFLRNAPDLKVNWTDDDGKRPILTPSSISDTNYIKDFLEDRMCNMENVEEELLDSILEYVNDCVEKWKKIAKIVEEDRVLKMYEYYYDRPQQHVVLGDSGHEHNDNLKVVYSNAPQSLRDVEETIDFWV